MTKTREVGSEFGSALTLGQRENLHGRFIRQWDEEAQCWFCPDCLADLPPVRVDHLDHVCGTESAPSVEHNTKTFLVDPGPRLNWRTCQRVPQWTSMAQCSCGWSACLDTRELARSAARAHRT